MAKQKYSKELAYFFEKYPNETECILTADGQIFQMKASVWAKRHAQQNDLKYDTITRDGTATPATNVEGSNHDVDNMNYNELLKFAKDKEIPLSAAKPKKDKLIEEIKFFLNKDFNPDDLEEGEEGSEDEEGTKTEGADGSENEGEFTPTNTEE